MKKLFVCVLALALVTASVCAEKTKVHGIGLSLPIESQYWWNQQDADTLGNTTFFDVALNLNYKNMSVHGDSFVGFSAIYEIQLGFFWGSANSFDYSFLDALNMKWGWGVAFRPTEKIILATHGTLGGDFKFAIDPRVLDLTARMGWDFVFVYRCNEKFGISAGFDTYVPIIGFGICDFSNPSDDDGRSHRPCAIYGGIGCDFKFGVCWVY